MKHIVVFGLLLSVFICTRAMVAFTEKQNWEENSMSSHRFVMESNDSVNPLPRKTTSLLPTSGGGANSAFRALENSDATKEKMPSTTSLGEGFAAEIEQVMERINVERDETRVETMLVHTGDMSVRVKIAEKEIFQQKLDDIVKEIGKGYYQQRNFHSDSNQDDDVRSESLEVTIRVRNEQFEEVISHIKSIAASVVFVHTKSYDVASEFVDAVARSSVLDALRASLQTLMRQAQTVEEVLMLQREISRLIEEVESQQQRANRLQNQAEYSTLTLHIRFFAQSISSNISWKWNPFLSIKSGLYDTGILLITIADGIIYFAFGLLPLVLICLCLGFLFDRQDPTTVGRQYESAPKDPTEGKSFV